MRKLVLGAALSAACFVAPSVAMAGGFVGVNYTRLQQNDRYFGGDRFSTGEVFGRIGGHINKYVTTELRLGTTLSDKSQGKTRYQFNYNAGVYMELGYQFKMLRPYLLAGYTFGEEKFQKETNGTYTNESHHLHDYSYGAGVDFYLGQQLGINAEYIQYYDIGNITYKGPSVGMFYRF